MAQFAAQLEKYPRAIEIYEQIGTASIENPLLKYGARDHFFRAGMCHLCIDHLNCQQAISRYESILASFNDSRESNFLKVGISYLWLLIFEKTQLKYPLTFQATYWSSRREQFRPFHKFSQRIR